MLILDVFFNLSHAMLSHQTKFSILDNSSFVPMDFINGNSLPSIYFFIIYLERVFNSLGFLNF